MQRIGMLEILGQGKAVRYQLRAAAVPVKAVVHRLFIGRIAEIVTKEHAVAQRAVVAAADGVLPAVAAAHVHLYGDTARLRLMNEPVIPIVAAALFPLLQRNGEGEVNILIQHGELKALAVFTVLGIVIQLLQGLVRPSGLDGLIAGMPVRQRHTVPRPVLLYIVIRWRDDEHSVMVRRELIHPPAVVVTRLDPISDCILLLHQSRADLVLILRTVQLECRVVVDLPAQLERICQVFRQLVVRLSQERPHTEGIRIPRRAVAVPVFQLEPQKRTIFLALAHIHARQLVCHGTNRPGGDHHICPPRAVQDDRLIDPDHFVQHVLRDTHILHAANLVMPPVHAQLDELPDITHIAQTLDDHIPQIRFAVPVLADRLVLEVPDIVTVSRFKYQVNIRSAVAVVNIAVHSALPIDLPCKVYLINMVVLVCRQAKILDLDIIFAELRRIEHQLRRSVAAVVLQCQQEPLVIHAQPERRDMVGSYELTLHAPVLVVEQPAILHTRADHHAAPRSIGQLHTTVLADLVAAQRHGKR